MYSGQKKQKQGLRSKRGAITKIISLLLSIVLMIGTTYIMRSESFFNNVTNVSTQKYLVQ